MRVILAVVAIMATGCAAKSGPMKDCIIKDTMILCPVDGVYTPVKIALDKRQLSGVVCTPIRWEWALGR